MLDPSKYERQFLSREDAMFWVIIFSVSGVVIVFLNLVTILAFLANRTLRRRSVYCLINLAIADLIYGITGTVYCFTVFGFTSMNLLLDPKFCILTFLCTICTLLVSVFALVTVALERFCAFFLPFRHRLARRRVYIFVFVATWVKAIMMTSLSKFLWYKLFMLIYYLLLALSVIIISSSYIAVFIKIRKDNQQRIHTFPSFSQRRHAQEKHLAKTLCIVTVLSIITWVPYICYRFSYSGFDQDTLLITHPNVYSIMNFFQRMNLVVNPIVYIFRMRDFRKALHQLIFRGFCNRSVDLYPVGHRNVAI